MYRALSLWPLSVALRTTERQIGLQIPHFLCPAIGRDTCQSGCQRTRPSRSPRPPTSGRRSPWIWQRRQLHVEACAAKDPGLLPEAVVEEGKPPCLHLEVSAATAPRPLQESVVKERKPTRALPAQCTGCGALSQTNSPNLPGYFDLGRKVVRLYTGLDEPRKRRSREEDEIYINAMKSLNPDELEKLGVDMSDFAPSLASLAALEDKNHPKPVKVPLCDRCHNLLHHQTGVSIYHPSVDSIRDTLEESPYKYNHVYHVLDAADFPMSILYRIHTLLDLMPLRTKSRRSKAGKFYHGQQTEISFVIARSDLLAPTKGQVDSLLPYLREVLRDALGRDGHRYRLGNLRCVSARRSWWTTTLKEDIWRRGGAGWLVGKVNVGKSQLFEAVFPKGRMDWQPSRHQITVDMRPADKQETAAETGRPSTEDPEADRLLARLEALDDYSLLPPAPPETQYPAMPLVSDLPGTTASPIRVPYGNGKGELIDLPGIERTGLEKYVEEKHRSSLILRTRKIPTQMVIKPGQSLLLGGFIRITPRDPGPIVLSYAFTPIEPHLTSTEKAVGIQQQTGPVQVENIALPGTGPKTKLAGSYALRWDVTRKRAGPITDKRAAGIPVDRLPYRVLSADILIEGVGWVELVAQVRTRNLFGDPPPGPVVAADDTSAESEQHKQKAQGAKARTAAGRATKYYTTSSALDRLEALAAGPSAPKKRIKSYSQQPQAAGAPGEPNWPVVDVYSPEGKFIGIRQPMNGWLLNKPRVTDSQTKSRPRKSMKGQKKLEKARRRATAPAGPGPKS